MDKGRKMDLGWRDLSFAARLYVKLKKRPASLFVSTSEYKAWIILLLALNLEHTAGQAEYIQRGCVPCSSSFHTEKGSEGWQPNRGSKIPYLNELSFLCTCTGKKCITPLSLICAMGLCPPESCTTNTVLCDHYSVNDKDWISMLPCSSSADLFQPQVCIFYCQWSCTLYHHLQKCKDH